MGEPQGKTLRYPLFPLKMPYVSAVDLSDGDTASCVSDYINSSDQTLSHVEIEALTDKEGKIIRMAGFIAQLMPEGDKNFWRALCERPKVGSFDETGKEASLSTLLNKENYVLLGSAPVSFRCTCGEDRIKHSLQGLPLAEQQGLLDDDHIEIECHYCGKNMKFPEKLL